MVSSRLSSKSKASERVYHAWDDFNILDESRDAFALADYTPGRAKLLWANKELLSGWGLTMEQWRGIDCNKGNSDAIQEMNNRIFEVVQTKQEIYETPKTFHTRNGPLHGLLHVRPVRCLLPGEKEERILSLFAHYTTDEGSEHNSWRHSTELMYHLDVVCMMFYCEDDLLSAKAQYANLKAQDYYLEAKPSAERGRKPSQECSDLSLKKVLDSCVFDSAEERDGVLHGIRSLKLGSKRIEIICRKTPPKQNAKSSADDVNPRWHRVAFIPALDPAKSTPCILINEFDVSVLKRVKDDLSSVSQAQADLKDFLAVVGHELRTPLNGIIGLSQTIMRDEACSDRVRRSAEWIKHSGERLATLVVDVVDAARMQGKLKIEKKDEISLCEVVTSVWERINQKCVVKPAVDIANRVPADLPSVQGNRVRLTQVCMNLISNAVKFTEAGQVEVSAHRERVDGREHVRVEVADTGVGIPKEKLEDIWEAFRQGDMSASRKYEGTGLGLSLVREVVRAHFGSVGVTSRHGGPGSGSTFWFSLPISQPDFVPHRRAVGSSSDPIPHRQPPPRSAPHPMDSPPPRTASIPSSDRSGGTADPPSSTPAPPSSSSRRDALHLDVAAPPPAPLSSGHPLHMLAAMLPTPSVPGHRDAACNTEPVEEEAAAKRGDAHESAAEQPVGARQRVGLSAGGEEAASDRGGAAEQGRAQGCADGGSGAGGRGLERAIIEHLLRERSVLHEEMDQRSELHRKEVEQRDRITTSLFRDLAPLDAATSGLPAGSRVDPWAFGIAPSPLGLRQGGAGAVWDRRGFR